MLETIREYGAERLAARGEADELRRRHAAHYSALMREAGPLLLTSDQLRWIGVVQAEKDNIVAALRYWCDAQEAEQALSLAVSLSVSALLLGNEADVAEWVSDALAVPGEADDLRTMAEAAHMVTSAFALAGGQAPDGTREASKHGGAAGGRSGQTAGTRPAVRPGLTERIDALDVDAYPVAGLLRPVYAMFAKDDARVRRYLEQARASRDPWLAAASLMMAANLAENEGNLDEMRAAATEAAQRFRALGERWGLSAALQALGNARTLDGDLDDAAAAYSEAGRLLGELGSREGVSQVRLRLAELAARRGELDRARELSAQARAETEANGSAVDRGITVAWWAAFEAACGDIEAARPLQAAAERQLAQFGAAHPARDHLAAMVAATSARIAIADGDLTAAREHAATCYHAALAAQDMPLLALAPVAALALALGGPRHAAELIGATAVVRGAEDPTDLTVATPVPRLRAALGEDGYAACYAAGRALGRAEAIARLDPALL